MANSWILTDRKRAALALASLCLVPAAASATCPRDAGEQARRWVPSVLFWPSAPFVLTAKPKRVPMPPAGARIRVSAKTAGQRVVFTAGRLDAIDSAAVHLTTASGTRVTVARSTVLCVQVARKSARTGAVAGLTIGATSGIATGFAVAAAEPNPGKREEGYGLLPGAFGILGAAGGALIGSWVRVTAWDTALDLSR